VARYSILNLNDGPVTGGESDLALARFQFDF
jgi:hypothetical protein